MTNIVASSAPIELRCGAAGCISRSSRVGCGLTTVAKQTKPVASGYPCRAGWLASGDWVRDSRPVRRLLANQTAPTGVGEWPTTIPAVAQVLRDGLDLPTGVTLLV